MRQRGSSRLGFTIIELLIGMVVGLLILGAVYTVLISQSREYQLQRENVDVGETLRGAVALMVSELEHTSALRTDLYSIGAQSISLRSFQTAGTLCRKGATAGQYGVAEPSGLYASGTDDSLLAYRLTDQTWLRGKVTQVWTNPGGPTGTTTCVWAGWTAPRSIQFNVLGGDYTGVDTGSVIRAFRATTYSLVTSGGRTWLARTIGAAVTPVLLTGPLRASPNGLVMTYWDANGAQVATPTTDPVQLKRVVRVTITLRAESFLDVRGVGSARAPRADSVTVTAYVRN